MNPKNMATATLTLAADQASGLLDPEAFSKYNLAAYAAYGCVCIDSQPAPGLPGILMLPKGDIEAYALMLAARLRTPVNTIREAIRLLIENGFLKTAGGRLIVSEFSGLPPVAFIRSETPHARRQKRYRYRHLDNPKKSAIEKANQVPEEAQG